MIGGNWKLLDPSLNNKKQSQSSSCPSNCIGDTSWIAVDRNTPGHAYRDVVRSANYISCNINITSVLLTGMNSKRDEQWPHYFFKVIFPHSSIFPKHIPNTLRDKVH
jgi:hypothetical protein